MTPNAFKYSLVFLLLFVGSFTLYAQVRDNRLSITGKLVDDNKENLSYVAVKLYNAKDSSLVATAQTDEEGDFLFSKIYSGTYYLLIDFFGYQKINQSLVVEEGKNLNVGIINMIMAEQQLNTVDISFKKPLIERKDGKMIVNVSASILAAGSTAMEILSRIPGVALDNEGNASFRGKPGINIMIDGKLTYLSSSQLANLLRATAGNTIQTIEVISNPSAKYDAAGTGGIINIKLKKNTNFGTNGSLTLGGGIGNYHKADAGLNLNHRSGRINIFGNYNYANNKQYEDLLLTRSTAGGGVTTFFDQNARELSLRKNNSYKAGIDYFINSNNTIGFMINGYSNKYDGQTKIRTAIGSERNMIDSTVTGQNSFDSRYKNQTYNLNYTTKIDTLGQELSADLDFSQVQNNETASYNNEFSNGMGVPEKLPLLFKNYTPSKIKILAGKIDYTLPIGDKTKIETGIKSSFVDIDNDFRATKKIVDTWQNDESQSNRFLYKESVNAAYANLTKELHATTFQLGLRTEYTRTEGQSTTLNSKISRNYIDFFPSVALNHTLNKESTIGFTYSRRIDRPDYQSLNPFVYFSDLYTTSQGNPMLKPQYANSLELNYSLKKFNFSLAYIYTKNVITTTLLTDTVKKSISLFEQNLVARKTISFNVSRSVNFTNWWSSNNDATIYNSGFSSPELMGLPFENKKTTIELSTTHNFKFAPTLNAELAASYASSQVYGTYIAKPIYGLDLGISKSFADDRASIKFAVNDLFDQRRIAIKSAIQSQDYQLLQKQESRVFRLTFNYNFGSNLIKANRDRSNSSTDEQSRLRKGN